MRVISGSAKGKILKFPKSSSRIRPLSDYAKEGLFNILSAKLSGCVFLDLFAGTGQVGIEALSRGANLSIFVDSDKKAVSTIWENLSITNFTDRAEVYLLDVLQAINLLSKKNVKFDLIFIGAPYTVPILEKVLEKISRSDILNDRGVVIAEHHKKTKLKEQYCAFGKSREVSYGDTLFSFYLRGEFDENSGVSG